MPTVPSLETQDASDARSKHYREPGQSDCSVRNDQYDTTWERGRRDNERRSQITSLFIKDSCTPRRDNDVGQNLSERRQGDMQFERAI